MTQDLVDVEGLTPGMLVRLGETAWKTLDNLADLALGDELIEMVGADAMNEGQANDIIMAARAHWFRRRGRGDRPGPGRPEETAAGE